MNYPLQISNTDLLAFHKNWGWFLAWGIILIVLGGFAISYSVFTTLISIIFLGVLLAASGIIIIIDTFQFWWRKWGGFFIHLITGVLYFALGITLIKLPVLSSVSLTLLLSIFYIFLGIFRIIYSLSFRLPKYGWRIFNGILALILGILILVGWPLSGQFIIGLFIGIDLLICGWVYVMAALSARTLANK